MSVLDCACFLYFVLVHPLFTYFTFQSFRHSCSLRPFIAVGPGYELFRWGRHHAPLGLRRARIFFSAAQRPLQVARGCRRMCTMVRFRVFCLLWAAELKRVLATFSRLPPNILLFFRGWAGMVPPGQPPKPSAQQKFPHRERRIASWWTFCVPKT